jgi:hypothetical protein
VIDTLKKSRFNLILISMIISLYYAASIKVTEFHFLGIEFVPERPSAFFKFVWLAWLYFLVRYITYFRSENCWKKIRDYQQSVSADILGREKMIEEIKSKNENPCQAGWKVDECKAVLIKNKGAFLKITYSGRMSKGVTSIKSSGECFVLETKYFFLKTFFIASWKSPEILEFAFPFILAISPLALWFYFYLCDRLFC